MSDTRETMPTSDGPSRRATGDSTTTVGGGRFAPGVVIAGRYRVVSFLGKGGMGEVYRADDLTLGQAVAIKFLPVALAADESRLVQFRSEVRIGREVAHPNVCRVYDIVESPEGVFLAMEYVDGEDLSTLLRRIGRLPEEKALEIARQVCAGLAAAHDRGVIHRDLKPANIMLDGRGRVRLTDFGIAALGKRVEGREARAGTPAYMAPEQLAGHEATARSDLYALGLVLHELFTGKRMFAGETLDEIKRSRTRPPADDLTTTVREIDEAVERAIRWCVEPDPQRRPSSAVAVAVALPGGDPLAAALAAGETPSPEMVAQSGRSGRMHPAPATALLVVFLGLVGAVLAVTDRFNLAALVPLDKPPAAMVDRAKDVLKAVGVGGEVAERAHGYSRADYYRGWMTEQRPDDWARLVRQARPSYAYFWYRQTPVAWRLASIEFDRGVVSVTDPRWAIPGEAYVSLDLAGRLRRVYVLPPEDDVDDPGAEDVEPAPPIDFGRVFELADLDIGAFTEAEPRLHWKFRTDERLAWLGAYPEEPEIPLRVEAGVTDGRLAYFRFIPPWEDPEAERLEREASPPEETADVPPSLFDRLQSLMNTVFAPVFFALFMGVLCAGGFLTGRHLAKGSADTKGAWRLGLYGFATITIGKWFASDTLLPRNQFEVLDALSWGCFMGMGLWSAYVAFEPIVRRRWPAMLVGWTRLIGGRFLDPFVGRSVLIGAVAGALGAAASRFAYLWLNRNEAWASSMYWLGTFDVHLQFTNVVVHLVVPVLKGFAFLLILIWLRRVLRRDWAAALVCVPLFALMSDGFTNHVLAPWTSMGFAALLVVLYMRFGVLAAITAMVIERLVILMPPSLAVGDWTFGPTVPYLVALLAIGVWGLVASVREGRATGP